MVTLVHDALDCVTIAWMGNVIDKEGARPGVRMETLGDTVMNHAANVWVESATKKVFVCRVVRLEDTEETAMYLVRKIVWYAIQWLADAFIYHLHVITLTAQWILRILFVRLQDLVLIATKRAVNTVKIVPRMDIYVKNIVVPVSNLALLVNLDNFVINLVENVL